MKMVEECPTYGLSGPLTIKDVLYDTEEILPLLNKLPNLRKDAIKRENCDRFSSEEYTKRQKIRSEHTNEEINENLDGEFDIESKWLKRKLEISEEQDTRMKRESSVEFVEHDPLDDSSLVSEEDGNGSEIIPLDLDFSDVVQWSFYPNHGTNLMYWQENYVKKVLAAVRFGKINLKQAADILGVAIRTAATRYRLEYGLVHSGASKMYLKGSSKGPKVEEMKVETADTNVFNDTFRNM
ncbi:uncharacterized protein [Epargyreus clarus]|uniref:uncharacterized protein isoform X2 n=1 Tax=Epargyreus clarus TaxID=520877 RepID=UPI003C2D0B6A